MGIVDPLWQEINEAIHQRKTEVVGHLVPKYLKQNRSSPEALYEASEFYRKITDYSNALRVLPKERVRARVSDAETKLELQLARLLNILGASNYALRMADRIRGQARAKSKIEMIEIYQCNYKYMEVVELLGSDFPVPEKEPWHQDWLLHFYLANAWNGLGHRDLAIERMKKIRAVSQSPLIRAMTFCYEGKYLVAAGEAENALPLLLESQKFFSKGDETADHAILQMCLGQCFLRLERYEEAKAALTKALQAFYQPGYKPEDGFEIVLMLERISGYRNQSRRLAPRLYALFGPDFPPLVREWPKEKALAEEKIFSVLEVGDSGKNRHLDRKSDTAWKGRKARLKLDLVDELIWTLIYAGEYGLPQFRLYEMLWPEEPFSFDQHQKRLERLVGRARKQGYEILWQDLHLRLVSQDVSVTGRPEKVIRGHSFLLEYPRFTRRDVEKYFSISASSAKALCREWVGNGLVYVTDRARYQVVP